MQSFGLGGRGVGDVGGVGWGGVGVGGGRQVTRGQVESLQ